LILFEISSVSHAPGSGHPSWSTAFFPLTPMTRSHFFHPNEEVKSFFFCPRLMGWGYLWSFSFFFSFKHACETPIFCSGMVLFTEFLLPPRLLAFLPLNDSRLPLLVPVFNRVAHLCVLPDKNALVPLSSPPSSHKVLSVIIILRNP